MTPRRKRKIVVTTQTTVRASSTNGYPRRTRTADEWRHLVDAVNDLRDEGYTATEACRDVGIAEGTYYSQRIRLYGYVDGTRVGRKPKREPVIHPHKDLNDIIQTLTKAVSKLRRLSNENQRLRKKVAVLLAA